MVATFHLHYLGHKIKYGSLEVRDATQQLLPTARPCCSIEFIESFLFWVMLVTYNIGIYIFGYIFIKLAIFIIFLLPSTVMFFMHCMLNILRYEKKKKIVTLMNRLLHSTIDQVMWSIKWCDVMFPLVTLSLAYRWVNQLKYFW